MMEVQMADCKRAENAQDVSGNQVATLSELAKAKDNAYWERNQLVAALSKLLPSFLSRHPDSDTEWDDDWRNLVVMTLPAQFNQEFVGADKATDYQMTWHIHDHDLPMFDHLHFQEYYWDGHTTPEKYRRLRSLVTGSDLVSLDYEARQAYTKSAQDNATLSNLEGQDGG